MDLSEQRLLEEVLYLHSLWRQGPPRDPNSNPNPNPNPTHILDHSLWHQQVSPCNPNPNPTHIINHSLWHQGSPCNPNPTRIPNHSLWHQGPLRNLNPNPTHVRNHSLWHRGSPCNPNPYPYPRHRHNPSHTLHLSNRTSHFNSYTHSNPVSKKIKKKKRKTKPISDIPWPCEEAIPDTSLGPSGWPHFKPHSVVPARAPSAEELAKRAAALAQQAGLEACRGFFGSNAGSHDDDGHISEDDDDEEEEEEEENGGFEGSEEFKFFLKLFADDGELRDYYEKSCELGEFCCLVCGGSGEKVGRKYKDCVALVQHTVTISKTKKRKAHRAYGQVICNILGWDINRLPTIPFPKSSESQQNGESVNAAGNGNAIQTEGSNVCGQEELAKKDRSSSSGDTGELVDSNIVLEPCDAVGKMEDFDEGVSEISGVSGLVNGLRL